jgi:hypothetical protein
MASPRTGLVNTMLPKMSKAWNPGVLGAVTVMDIAVLLVVGGGCV